MNLLEYTKKLSEKIRFYDSIVQKSFINPFSSINPFAKPLNITVIWIENEED